MNGRKNGEGDPVALRADLAGQLRAQIPEIRSAIFNRVREISESVGERDPTYVAGLQGAIGDAVNFSIETIEKGPEPPTQVPLLVVGQARRAAREGVRLDTVMRRYTAGNKVLEDFVVEASAEISDKLLRQILAEQGMQVDRVMDAASTAYRDEFTQVQQTAAKKRADRIARLLDSESRIPPAEIDYDFDLWHVGLILKGRGAASAGRLFAERLGFRSLHGEREAEIVWTWLGSRREPAVADILRAAQDQIQPPISVAIGESRRGIDGWRQTHREAQAALRVMWRRHDRFLRGRDVVLLAAVLKDETTIHSLLDAYLAPLEDQGHRAEDLPETLRRFFAAGWNAAAAAEQLGVNRHTVRQRIRRIEKILGQPLSACSAQLQIALQVASLGA